MTTLKENSTLLKSDCRTVTDKNINAGNYVCGLQSGSEILTYKSRNQSADPIKEEQQAKSKRHLQ